MKRPLRSLLIGDCDHYFSPYIFGVAAACSRLGIWHTQVSIRSPEWIIRQRVKDARPDLIWTHMLLWAPEGSCPRHLLLSICEDARRAGSRVVMHDGDYKAATRYPHDISAAVDLALCNHKHDRGAWKVPALHWPYAAFPQDAIADPDPSLACDVFFAGQLGSDPTYDARRLLIDRLRRTSLDVRVADPNEGNTMLRTPEIAASARGVLGCGRRGVSGWVDTRVFQYPGAGAVLLHDDAAGFLDPWTHFVPYRTGDPASIEEAVAVLKAEPDVARQIRGRAFRYVQQDHSYAARVRQVLAAVGLT